MIGDVKTMVLTTAASNRAAVALNRIINLGESFSAAATAVGTSRRTILKYLALKGIKIFKNKQGRYEVIRSPAQKIREFLDLMLVEKYSATKAAKELNTTVNTMSKQMLPDMSGKNQPIIVKTGNSWTPNFLGVREYSMTLYGSLIALNDNVQGRGQQAGPRAKQDDADQDYADIWWQVDFNSFESTLPIQKVGEFWKPDIMDFLRKTLETPTIQNQTLATKFLGNASVNTHATAGNRIVGGQMALSRLEEFLQRYHIRMSPYVNVGVEPVAGLVVPITFVSMADFAQIQNQTATGVFNVMYLTKTAMNNYPIPVSFKYDLQDEQ